MNKCCWSVLGVVFLIWGCNGESSFSVSIQFPDDVSRQAAQSVTVYSLLPEGGASCSDLMTGSAGPGDTGFAIEDQLRVEKPAGKSSGSLKMGDAGQRLFYAEGFDQDEAIFLKGCQSVDWTGKGPEEVTISLQHCCEPCEQDADCDDGLYCSGDESCVDGACVPGYRDCDDGDPCTIDACNEDQDRCDHEPVTDPPEQEGPPGDASCSDSLDNDCDGFTDLDDTACTACDTDADCDDADPCTEDSCDSGVCANDPITTGCECGTPPDSASLSCQSPVSLASSDTSGCTLTFTGGDNTGLEECISCTARVGLTIVDASDFGAGACDLNGWTLVTGENCRARVANCSIGGGPQFCCDAFGTLCETATFGQPVLRTDFDANCGGGLAQWRLQKTFDLSGLTAPRVCFDLAGDQASADSGVLVLAEDGQHASEQIFCNNGVPQPEVGDFFYSYCADLPAWAAGSAATKVTFLMHSEGTGEVLYLDNITLRAWGGGCARDVVSLLDEDFSGCDTSGWTVSGATTCADTGCSNQTGWRPGVFGDGGSFEMRTSLDANAADGEVVICLRIGSDQPQDVDAVTLSYNAGGGFQPAWRQQGKLGPDGTCREVCVNLSDLDPAVDNNPSLGIRIEVDSNGAIGLFGVSASAARYCDAVPAAIDIQSPPNEGGAGTYTFELTNVHGEQLSTVVDCQLDPEGTVRASDLVRFLP